MSDYAAEAVGNLDAQSAFELCRKHGLLPDHSMLAVGVIQSLVAARETIEVKRQGSDDVVANLFAIDVYDGENGYLAVILAPDAYANGDREQIEAAVREASSQICERHGLRRLNTTVPVSRSRTKRLLRGAGFAIEGRMRSAWRGRGRKPEDVYLMGFVPIAAEGE